MTILYYIYLCILKYTSKQQQPNTYIMMYDFHLVQNRDLDHNFYLEHLAQFYGAKFLKLHTFTINVNTF